jgi:hypothetical protein
VDDAHAFGEEYGVADLSDALTSRLGAESARSLVMCVLARLLARSPVTWLAPASRLAFRVRGLGAGLGAASPVGVTTSLCPRWGGPWPAAATRL